MTCWSEDSSATNDFLDSINTEFEQSFTKAARISKEFNCLDESHLAAKRVFSYNPNSKEILSLFPQYTPIIEEISKLVDDHGQSLKTDSGNPFLWTILGNCYLTLGDFPNAFAAYAHAIRVNLPENPDPNFWYALGIVYAHYNYTEHALNCFNKVFEFDQNFVFANDINFRIAFILRQTQNFQGAISFFEKIIHAPPSNLLPEDIQIQIAYTYQIKGNSDTAYQIYRELYQRYPSVLKLQQQYTWFLYLIDYIDVMKPILEKAIQENPYDPTLLLIAARLAMKEDDIATAYKYYKFCIHYCSESPSFWCGLGILYYKNDQINDAVIAFQRALFLKCELADAWLNIGLIFEQQGNFQSAEKIYTTGSSKCQNCPEFQERLNSLSIPHRKSIPYNLIDIDDSKFLTQIPEQFSIEYISAVPMLPPNCYGINIETASQFSVLSTYPKSLFR